LLADVATADGSNFRTDLSEYRKFYTKGRISISTDVVRTDDVT
jgi:hypothetical protein